MGFDCVWCKALPLCLWCHITIGFHGFLLVGFPVLSFYVLRVLRIGLGKRKLMEPRESYVKPDR